MLIILHYNLYGTRKQVSLRTLTVYEVPGKGINIIMIIMTMIAVVI